MTIMNIAIILYLARPAISTNHLLLEPFQQVCPRSMADCDIAEPADNSTTKTNYADCCGRCSCAADCGHSQSCCLVEDNAAYTHIHGEECINPIVGNEFDFVASGGRGVMMVTRCIDQSEGCKYSHGNVNVSPVESDTGDVFINRNCALCNNVSSFTRWNVEIKARGSNLKIETFRSLGDTETNTTDVDTKIFLPTLTSTPTECQVTFRNIDESKCPNKSVEEMCKSVLLPFVLGHVTYRNYFCYLCAEHGSDKCTKPGDTIDRTNVGSFTLILNERLNVNDISVYFNRRNVDSEVCPEHFIPHPYKVCIFKIQ